MKTIILFVHDDVGQEARIRVALDLARAMGGRLLCADVAMMPSGYPDFIETGIGAIKLEEEARFEHINRRLIEERLTRSDVPCEWVELVGKPAKCIGEAAGLADLVVINRDLDTANWPDMIDIASELAVGEHLPVLAVPPTATGFDPAGKAIVAWDGSQDAIAALRAAVPLLRRAREVLLLHVKDGSLKVPLETAAAFLEGHDVTVTTKTQVPMLDPPALLILDEVARYQPDYVVMGGFRHSNFVESIFGGTTRAMLKECPVPIFMAHRP